MSMGAWILSLFGACAVPGLIALELHAHQTFTGTLDQLLRLAAGGFIFGSAIFGTLLATYTGVLIGATAIPAWFSHRTLLPIHFGTAGLGSAAALLELLGHRIAALNFLGYYAAGVESALLIWLSLDKQGAANRAIHEHGSGWLIRIGEILNGPLALGLRFFGLIPFAALSFLIGALVSRFGWIWVGKISGSDPEAVFASNTDFQCGFARTLLLPMRRVTPSRSRRSRNGMITRRLVPRSSRNSEAPAELFLRRKATTASRIFTNCPVARTTSVLSSTSSPQSRRKRSACCDVASGA